MSAPALTTDQNILPVQAYFNLDGTFNTFIGQGQPFYATVNPIQSGLTITNSTINSTTIGLVTPASATFTNVSTTTGSISTTPANPTDLVNKSYVDMYVQGYSIKTECQVATTGNITLSGLQTIDGYTTVSGDRVLVKNQNTQAQNGIYVASSGAWSRSADANTWNSLIAAFTFIQNGSTQANSGWVCTIAQGGTLGTTPVTWSQLSSAASYFAGTGLTLSSYTFSITPVGTAGTYGSASSVPVFVTNASGQVTSVTNTPIAISNTQVSGLGTMSTQNANNVAITGGSITGTPISGSTVSGSTVTATTQFTGPGTGLTGTATVLNIGGNAATATTATSATTATTSTNIAGGVAGSLPYQSSASNTSFLGIGTNGYYLTVSGGLPTWSALPTNVSSFSAGTTGFTPSTATTGSVTLSGTLNVANGGTGVTSSSGANSVVLRDANANISVNCLFEGTTSQPAGSLITLTAASVQNWIITGSGGQTIKLPNATTLPVGAQFTFNNNQSSGTIVVQNNSATTVCTTQSGAYIVLVLLDNTSAAGSWDFHNLAPSDVSWSTNTFDYAGSITSATWNGNVIALNRGGTAANLTAVAGGVVYSTASAMAISAAGTTGQFLKSNGTGAPTWATPSGSIAVSDVTLDSSTYYPTFLNVTGGNETTTYTSSTKLTYVPSTGVFTATGFSGSGSSLTNLTANNLSGTIPSTVLSNSSLYIGTTAIALNRASASQSLTGVSIDGSAGSATTATTATVAQNVYVTDSTTSTSTFYPTMSPGTAATTNYALGTSSSKLTFVPNTGLLTTGLLAVGGGSSASSPGLTSTTSNFYITPLAPTGNNNAGTLTISAATAPGLGNGGSVVINSGSSTNGAPGNITVASSNSSSLSAGGSISLTAGNGWSGGGGSQFGGNITLTAGTDGGGGGNGGNVTLVAGTTSGGINGSIQLQGTTSVSGAFNSTGAGQFGTYLANYIQAQGASAGSQPILSAQGLDTNIALALTPKGSGALQAQQTTSTTAGGNARGASAVDWQTVRSSAAQVASGLGTVISGGRNNTSSGTDSFVGGGNGNSNNSGNQGVLAGGSSNVVSGSFAVVAGGYSNTAAGEQNFIGGGYGNSGTSATLVTSQATSTITSGSTAVTLSASNSSIKVGQVILGTPINSFPRTYVAAISGTSLTLSQNATSSTNATLSFYTPHGVVVGGGNNQATGAYSFIGGGGDAGTAGNRNVASGDWSVVVGGLKNTATASYASVLGGSVNNATGNNSIVVGGSTNNSTNTSSMTFGGYGNTASGSYSFAIGQQSNTRGIFGAQSFSTSQFTGSGDSQTSVYQLAILTTTATTTELVSGGATSQGNSASTTTIPVLPAPSASTSSVFTFRGLVSAKDTASTNAAGWEIKGVIQRTGSATTTVALVGTPTIILLGATAGAVTAGWGLVGNVTVTADTTYGGISVNVTGAASTTIRWNCRLDTSELA